MELLVLKDNGTLCATARPDCHTSDFLLGTQCKTTDAVRTKPTNQWEGADTHLPNEMQKLSGNKGVIGWKKSSTNQQDEHHPNCPEINIHPEEVLG